MNPRKIIYLILPLFLQYSPAILTYEGLIFHKTIDTLTTIRNIIERKEKGAYLRFGDGEVNHCNGGSDMFHGRNPALQREMQETFSLNGSTILKSLPLHCRELGGFEDGMFPGNHEASYGWSFNLINKAKSFWNGPIKDIYSPVALHFAATQYTQDCIEFLKLLKKSNCAIFIGNRDVPKHIQSLLFGDNCKFVPTPPRNAYNEINRIEQEALNHMKSVTDYAVIITAMGSGGKVLQKRLWQKLDNVFLFDFGSLLDALCGWDTRAWIKLSKFNATQFINLLSENNTPAKRTQNPEMTAPSEIRIVCTAALINNQYDMRKNEYIHGLTTLKDFGFENPYIVEAIKRQGPTFLDEYSSNVFYSTMNNGGLRNKGVNEARTLLEGLKHFNFNPNDMIVKLTGRYFHTSDKFFQFIQNNPDCDAFIKTQGDQITTTCFALRCHYLIDMLENIDYNAMEHRRINFERLAARYIDKIVNEKKAKVMVVDKLDLTANIFGTGNPQLIYLKKEIEAEND